jgi:hypothetical protein
VYRDAAGVDPVRRIVEAARIARDGSGVSEYVYRADGGAQAVSAAGRGIVVGAVEFRESPEVDE